MLSKEQLRESNRLTTKMFGKLWKANFRANNKNFPLIAPYLTSTLTRHTKKIFSANLILIPI